MRRIHGYAHRSSHHVEFSGVDPENKWVDEPAVKDATEISVSVTARPCLKTYMMEYNGI